MAGGAGGEGAQGGRRRATVGCDPWPAARAWREATRLGKNMEPTTWGGGEAGARPASKAERGSLVAPYPASARPALGERKVRRERPVPAGVGIPVSIAGRPLPACA